MKEVATATSWPETIGGPALKELPLTRIKHAVYVFQRPHHCRADVVEGLLAGVEPLLDLFFVEFVAGEKVSELRSRSPNVVRPILAGLTYAGHRRADHLFLARCRIEVRKGPIERVPPVGATAMEKVESGEADSRE